MHEPDTVWEFSMVDQLKFGCGSIEELNDELVARNVESVIVVTDEGLRETDVVNTVLKSIPDQVKIDIFDGVVSDPDIDVYRAATELVSDVTPDAIVGVGGGSSMDVAKVSGTLGSENEDVSEYIAPPIGDGRSVPHSDIFVTAIPTTAGTGSETSPAAIVSLADRELKVGISSRHIYPDLSIVDPLLTVSLPPTVTASSGMDALSHAIESYVTRRYDTKKAPDSALDRPDYNGRTPMTELYAEKAIELIGSNLRQAVENGTDIEARRNMSLGSLLAGISFTNAGLGATHAIAYPVAGENHTPHGITIASLLPSVIEYNVPTAAKRYSRIAELLGEDTTGLSVRDKGEKAIEAVELLANDIGMQTSIAELGVEKADIPRLAEKTQDIQRLLVGNPRRVEQDDVEWILTNAL